MKVLAFLLLFSMDVYWRPIERIVDCRSKTITITKWERRTVEQLERKKEIKTIRVNCE